MKKLNFVFIPLTTTLLSGCFFTDLFQNKDVRNFNNIVEKDYSSFVIKVTTNNNGDELNSTYNIKKENGEYAISYSRQKYNAIDLNSSTVPDTAISTEIGEYKTNDARLNLSRFKFSEDDFKSYSFNSGSFTGKIDDAKNYLGADYSCLNFEITFKYSDYLSEIEMSYTMTDSISCKILINNFTL